ncbi:MAG: co-chaperone HscB [Gammaproteobacteria bacterium]|nr:co-chaperone HscB [Gammaproteobacteria bacterium]
MNYFELFALPSSYCLDLNELRSKYLELQRAVHPDKYANASERERLLAVQKTAQINDGFGMLKNPINRAEHLLSLAGIELAHEYQTVKDPMFLMEQMELREELEEIPSANDPEQSILDFQQQIDQHISTFEQQFINLFAANDQSSLAIAADNVRKLKFMLKLASEAQDLEERLLGF